MQDKAAKNIHCSLLIRRVFPKVNTAYTLHVGWMAIKRNNLVVRIHRQGGENSP